jgi:hypothetical protein
MKKINLFLTLFLILFQLNAQNTYKLLEVETYASCIRFIIIDDKNSEVILPQEYNTVLDCPSLIDITGNILTFESEGIKQLNIDTGKEVLLFKNFDDIDGCSGPVWSSDRTRLMFVSINQEQKHDFTAPCRITVISLNKNGEPENIQEFDRSVYFRCGSVCFSDPYKDFWFVTNKTIGFIVKNHETDEFTETEIDLEN